MSAFFQEPPRLTNTFESHRWLRAYVRFKFPKDLWSLVEEDLRKLGERCATDYISLARQAEREKPVHVPFDPWGRRIDEIRVSTAWQELQDISAREAMIATGYKRAHGAHSRLLQFMKLYLFHPSSAFFTCPLAMADGAAKVLETYGKDDIHRTAFNHLTSTDPKQFWTSGQWMTEKTGGSDVSDTSTEVKYEGTQARLFGTKWFSSATTSHMSLALARAPQSPAGSKGLTLFLVPMFQSSGALNHIRVLRLKDKLGTWALPTAEIELEGSLAYQVGERDHGVKTVATMLNVTRLYNSVCSIGQATRALEQLRDYSAKRTVFGAKLGQQVLHYSTFAREELKLLAGFLLTMELVHILGREEVAEASSQDSDILRLMTPICKLLTARYAIQTASEVVEGFGGVGYVEDSGIPVHLRDSQVFPIWEGATNVLSLDMLRVMQKGSALASLSADIQARLKAIKSPAVTSWRDQLAAQLKTFEKQLGDFAGAPADVQLASSRDLAFYIGRLYAFVLLLGWMDKESAANQATLSAWARLFATEFLGNWSMRSPTEVGDAREVWDSALKI